MSKEFKNNPFAEALKGFKPAAAEKHELTAPKVEEPSRKEASAAKSPEKSRELNEEDAKLFGELTTILCLSPQGKKDSVGRYWRLRDVIRDSHEFDIAHNLRKHTGWEIGHARPYIPVPPEHKKRFDEICTFLVKRGWEATAKRFLLSTTPEGMVYGDASREHRFEIAKEYTDKAGTTIKDIIEKFGLQL